MEQLEVESKARLERRKVFHRLCALSQRGRVSAFAGSPKGLLRVPALARPRVEQPEAPRADVDRSSGSGKMVQSLPGRTADLWAVRSLCCFCSAPAEAAPRNTIGRGGSVVWNEYQFSAEGGLRLPSCALTASAWGKSAFPAGASKPVDIPRLSVLLVALKFQEESQRSNC